MCRLGSVDYDEAWRLQGELAEARSRDRIPDVLLLLEHPHTFTLGRRGSRDNILLPPQELLKRGIAVHDVDRGGDVTYHGPGQLVGYPILKLPVERLDYVRYIRDLELALLKAIRDLGVPANLQDGFSGVWVCDEKVCAIGVKIGAHGVTSHGFAINVKIDLEYFGYIVPCGITDKGVTSLDRVSKREISMSQVEEAAIRHVAGCFCMQSRENVSPEKLMEMLTGA